LASGDPHHQKHFFFISVQVDCRRNKDLVVTFMLLLLCCYLCCYLCKCCDSYVVTSRNHPRVSGRSSAKWKSLVTKERMNGELGRWLAMNCHDGSSPQLPEKRKIQGNESTGKEEARGRRTKEAQCGTVTWLECT
jgi:hypothetical protein